MATVAGAAGAGAAGAAGAASSTPDTAGAADTADTAGAASTTSTASAARTAEATDTRITGQAGRHTVSSGIRQALSSGDMVPGQRLIEQELSDLFRATRSAVREALQDLAADDLVELVPRRGARVRVVSVEEAVQITECRAALEGLCAARAARLATPEDRAGLRDIGTRMRQAVTDGDLDTYSALNRRLHDVVARTGGQKVAESLLDRLNARMVRHQFRLALRPGRPLRSLPQHLALIDAIVAGDTAGARAAAHAHLDSVIEELRATPEGRALASREPSASGGRGPGIGWAEAERPHHPA